MDFVLPFPRYTYTKFIENIIILKISSGKYVALLSKKKDQDLKKIFVNTTYFPNCCPCVIGSQTTVDIFIQTVLFHSVVMTYQSMMSKMLSTQRPQTTMHKTILSPFILGKSCHTQLCIQPYAKHSSSMSEASFQCCVSKWFIVGLK